MLLLLKKHLFSKFQSPVSLSSVWNKPCGRGDLMLGLFTFQCLMGSPGSACCDDSLVSPLSHAQWVLCFFLQLQIPQSLSCWRWDLSTRSNHDMDVGCCLKVLHFKGKDGGFKPWRDVLMLQKVLMAKVITYICSQGWLGTEALILFQGKSESHGELLWFACFLCA